MRAGGGAGGRRCIATLVGFAGVLGAAGCGGGPAPAAAPQQVATTTASSPAAASTGSCPESGVRVTVGPVDAALGVRAVTLTLLNCGSAAYAVGGYPGLRLLDQERSAIDVQVIQEPDPVARSAPAPGPFGLVPGARAQAVVLWRNTVELGTDPTPGAYLCVRPAPSEAEQALPLDVDLGTTGRLTAGPWRPVP